MNFKFVCAVDAIEISLHCFYAIALRSFIEELCKHIHLRHFAVQLHLSEDIQFCFKLSALKTDFLSSIDSEIVDCRLLGDDNLIPLCNSRADFEILHIKEGSSEFELVAHYLKYGSTIKIEVSDIGLIRY